MLGSYKFTILFFKFHAACMAALVLLVGMLANQVEYAISIVELLNPSVDTDWALEQKSAAAKVLKDGRVHLALCKWLAKAIKIGHPIKVSKFNNDIIILMFTANISCRVFTLSF